MQKDLDPLALLPHRPPFVFVDKIIEFEPGMRAVGVKVVAKDEWYFKGHFPGNPLVPGVILTEALAQTSGIALNSGKDGGRRTYLSAIRSMKFRQPVLPGSTVVLTATKQCQLGEVTQFSVNATVEGVIVAEGEIVMGWVK